MKLDKETTDKLTKMAEEQWDRLAEEAKKEGNTTGGLGKPMQEVHSHFP